MRATLRSEPGFRLRLIAVLGSSAALADHLARHPGDALLLRGADGVRRPTPDELRPRWCTRWRGNPLDEYPVSDLAALNGTDPSAALTAAYKRHILHLAARDLTGVVTWTRWPPSWPTSRPPRCAPPCRWPGPSCPRARPRPGWP